MSPAEVPAELVEKATEEFATKAYFQSASHRQAMRAALTAVVPDIQAQALRDAADELATCPGSCGDHRPATHRNDARTLRSRAARLTATTEEGL